MASKLLIITQKVDVNDPILGFFHNWILKLSKKYEKIVVICLMKGEHNLPPNVQILSLGKEEHVSKFEYITRFYKYIFSNRNEYQSVLVHMNQEYILLGGLFWKLMGKKINLWRNHPKGSIFTYIAVLLSNKVFCTSNFSFTAKFKKTVIMPVGIDTEQFIPSEESKILNSILFFGRMDPIKRPDLLLKALRVLKDRNIKFSADFYGNSTEIDSGYLKNIKKEYSDLEQVNFYNSVSQKDAVKIFQKYDIYVNLTPTGSMDKTILEAAATGVIPIVSNKYFNKIFDPHMVVTDSEIDIANKLEYWLNLDQNEKINFRKSGREYVINKHSLNNLVSKFSSLIN